VTRRRAAGAGAADEAEQGINDLEGHLLWAAEIAGAHGAGEQFASQFDWATTDERDDLARVYAEQRLRDSHQLIERTADRARCLRAQYEHRWQQVQSRLVLIVLLTLVAIIFVATLLCALN
jgi:hypothetical protein